MNSLRNVKINNLIFVLSMSIRYIQSVFHDYWPSILSNLDIVIISTSILIFLIQIIYKYKVLFYKYELINIICVVIGFILLTLYYSNLNYNGIWLNRTTVELLYIVISVMEAFCVFNLFELNQLNICMKNLLAIYIIIYVFELLFKGIKLTDFFKITLIGSYSPTESQYVASAAMMMFYYFYTFKIKENRRAFIISLVFLILVFKRPLIAGASILMLLDFLFDLNITIKKRWIIISKIFFVIATIIWSILLNDSMISIIQQTYGVNLNDFTESRTWLYNALINSGYKTSGYGTTTIELGKAWFNSGERYLEMDLVKIYLEVGIIGLCLFVNNYFNLVRYNLYNFLMMITIFVTLLFSSSLAEPTYWAGIMIIMGLNIYYKNDIGKCRRSSYLKMLNIKFVNKSKGRKKI